MGQYVDRFLMTPKFFMTKEETENPKRGGISSYAWFHWGYKNVDYSVERYINLEDYFKRN